MRCVGATLMLVLLAAGGRAWGEPPALEGMRERASALIRARDFDQAAAMLRRILLSDPANREAKEMLAFALESAGDLQGERRVRSELASEYPDDPRVQADYGRVLERSREDPGALQAYRRARQLSAGGSTAELDAAIERMKGRTALEVGTPRLARMSDPDGTASSVQVGAAVPFGASHHVAVRGTHHAARGNGLAPAKAVADVLALVAVLRNGAGASWSAGPSLHVVSPPGGARTDVGVGGTIAGRVPMGAWLEGEGKAEAEAPWDEAAVAVLCGGRSTAAEGHLYAHALSRRLLLQAGARQRRLSIREVESASRPRAWQSLWIAGADVVVWTRPEVAVRGEMLDEALISPATLSPATTLAYRHYGVSTRTTPGFAAHIGIVPRAAAL